MSLREILTSMLEQVDGAHAVMLMGYDCMAVDEVRRGEPAFDVQAMAVEYATVIREIRRTIEVVGAGAMEEMTITTTNASMVLRILNDDFFAVFVLSRTANQGKARFLLSARALDLIQSVE